MSDRRQRQKEQRAAKREAERKQESRRALFRTIGTALVFGVIVIAVLAISGAFGGEDPGDIPASYEDFRDQETACGAEAPPPEVINAAVVGSIGQRPRRTDATGAATSRRQCGQGTPRAAGVFLDRSVGAVGVGVL